MTAAVTVAEIVAATLATVRGNLDARRERRALIRRAVIRRNRLRAKGLPTFRETAESLGIDLP